ncbi:MAG: ShlB/FhaC/HecB family hemolysin secretion/activation protein [Rouxiella aceris]|uniref:ShlB/FhaC/HecB family hemolysin secretion/activation protein n=1 Tax=Rouxiella aceris TaxID=2703884 RepID=UPI00284BE01D|nr:ShlB/FhaC/HecB family hemolysin secretion/activation protein [Rouxiella aceris]MDR3433070.1 ShlB/FhaC/HecB family hemolysin secretion/activation protein [Rouxiella aceris]
MKKYSITLQFTFFWLFIFCFFCRQSFANQQLIYQNFRQQALERQLSVPLPEVHLLPGNKRNEKIDFPHEEPCFFIYQIKLTGREKLPFWLPLQNNANQGVGKCLGFTSIRLLAELLQKQLVDNGYVTSQVQIPPQDLRQGILNLQLTTGTIGQLLLTADSYRAINLYNAFPLAPGEPLDLADVEQGVANLRRLPTVAADAALVATTTPGVSDVAVHWQQAKMWRLGASLDNSGPASSGRYQMGLSLSLDNPLLFNDLFYLSASNAVQRGSKQGNSNFTGHYSLPFGYWLTAITVNRYDYHQHPASRPRDDRYRGNSKNVNFQLSRVLQHNDTQKTLLNFTALARVSHTYIDDSNIDSKHRHSSAWRLGVQHQHQFGTATLSAGLRYQQATQWFAARETGDNADGQAATLGNIVQVQAEGRVPLRLYGQNLDYTIGYFRQQASAAVMSQDQFAIGNRWTVRGFDGEQTLNANSGWWLRNELAWQTPVATQQLYMGVDYGKAGRGSRDWPAGSALAGTVVGLRGRILNTDYDLFVGLPLAKPTGFAASPVSLAFTLNWQY